MVHLDDDVFVDGEAVHGLMIICTIGRRRAINGVVRKGDQKCAKNGFLRALTEDYLTIVHLRV